VFPLPLLPDYVLGIINRYSVPFALLDMGLLISGRPSRGVKVLVLKEPEGARTNLGKTAFCIDDVIDIAEIPLADLLPVGEGVESSFSWKGKNILVLDIRGNPAWVIPPSAPTSRRCFSLPMAFYLRQRGAVSPCLKYICVLIDMTTISAIVFVSGTYPQIYPPISFLSIHALLYTVLIVLGSFRYDARCAFFSGVYAAFTYFAAILPHAVVLDVPYTALILGAEIPVRFPLYNEVFRLLGMIVADAITDMACFGAGKQCNSDGGHQKQE
jgi:hypothetical protein